MCLIPRDSHRITWSLKLPASCYLLCNLRNRNISLLLLFLHLVLPIRLCLGTTRVVEWRDLKLTRHQWHHRGRPHRHLFKEINIKSIRMRYHQEWRQLLEAAPSRTHPDPSSTVRPTITQVRRPNLTTTIRTSTNSSRVPTLWVLPLQTFCDPSRPSLPTPLSNRFSRSSWRRTSRRLRPMSSRSLPMCRRWPRWKPRRSTRRRLRRSRRSFRGRQMRRRRRSGPRRRDSTRSA